MIVDIYVFSVKVFIGEIFIDFGDNDFVIIDIENLEIELKNVNLIDFVDNLVFILNYVVVMVIEELFINLIVMRFIF